MATLAWMNGGVWRGQFVHDYRDCYGFDLHEYLRVVPPYDWCLSVFSIPVAV